METYEFTQFAPSCCTVHATLVRSVTNATQLLQDLKSKGAEAFPLQLALIDAAYITSKEHLLIAIHQALLSNSRSVLADEQLQNGKAGEGEVIPAGRGLKTKGIHSEVLWNLSISSNIMDSFRTFGLSEKTKDIIVVHIADQDGLSRAEVLSHIVGLVQGTLRDEGLSILDAWKADESQDKDTVDSSPVDWDRVVKVYKLEKFSFKRQIDSLVSSMVAMKSVAS